jgi:peptidoglycan L-alanyl-D-glutamate endopeptidase CwlK
MKKNEANEKFVRSVQQWLGVTADGWAGSATTSAFERRIREIGGIQLPEKEAETRPQAEAQRFSLTFDDRSERNLKTLQPHVEELARRWLTSVRDSGINMVVICGIRTFEEQDRLYAQGRTLSGKIVTSVRAGGSMHNYGLAWDAVLIKDGVAIWEGPHLQTCARYARALEIEWGGDWKKFYDSPHYQVSGGLTTATLRRQFPNGFFRQK